jgi:hypothetical protein
MLMCRSLRKIGGIRFSRKQWNIVQFMFKRNWSYVSEIRELKRKLEAQNDKKDNL